MRLATLPGPTPDGRLVVVSGDMRRAVDASPVAASLIDALGRWADCEATLRRLAAELTAGESDSFEFDPIAALAPLPRSPQWLDGSVFENHLELMARALHPDKPNEPTGFPFVYQGASDDFRGCVDEVAGYRFDEGIDFEGEFGVIVDHVPMRVAPADALAHIRLIVLLNDVSLRAYAAAEVRTGFGFLNAKPSTAFAPVALTPDELGGAWIDGRVHLALHVERSGGWFGHPHGSAMTYGFHDLIAHAARTRLLSAGTIIGSGTVSNPDRSVGSACIAERRAIETIDHGGPSTSFLADGETVRMWVDDSSGAPLFGEIHQRIVVES